MTDNKLINGYIEILKDKTKRLKKNDLNCTYGKYGNKKIGD